MLNLFLVFLKIGLVSIGGGYAVIPTIASEVVNKYHWIDQATFTNIITISQVTPGPLAINTSTFVGMKIGGLSKAIICSVGCVLAGIIISLLLYKVFKKYQDNPYFQNVLQGLKSLSLGLIIAAAFTIMSYSLFNINDLSSIYIDFKMLLVIIVGLIVMNKFKLGSISIMLLCSVVGLIM